MKYFPVGHTSAVAAVLAELREGRDLADAVRLQAIREVFQTARAAMPDESLALMCQIELLSTRGIHPH